MSTYDQFDRASFEEWLDSLHKRWYLKKGTRGVYVVKLSDMVGVEINSTLTGRDDVVDRANASMQMALVSLFTGQVLNKKAQGQSHFKRTKEWRANLAKGVERMHDAYLQNKAFYDNLSSIVDRGDYKKEWEVRIKDIPNYQQNTFLTDILARVLSGAVLSPKQIAAVERAETLAQEKPEVDEEYLQTLRNLWLAARRDGSMRDMDFIQNIAETVKSGRLVSTKQQAWLGNLFNKYRMTRLAFTYEDLESLWVF